MDLLMSAAVLLGLAALFSLINERFLRLQPTIGLMLLALAMTVLLFLLKLLGGLDYLGWEQTLVTRSFMTDKARFSDKAGRAEVRA